MTGRSIRLAALGLLAGLAQPVAAGVPAEESRQVEHHASGEFDVELTPAASAAGPVQALAIAKTFHGDLAATSTGTMLAVRTAVDGSAGYVAMEQVTGTLGGRRGSFALQHSGTMTRGAQSLSVTVVPDSATGDLAGLAGSMAIRIESGRHFYDFRYTLTP